jgi:hypothetical protein
MTNTEKSALLSCAKRLEKLASLENACFNSNKEEDKRIKKAIEPYMMWFEGLAGEIEEIVELSEKTGICKKHRLEEIIRYNLF